MAPQRVLSLLLLGLCCTAVVAHEGHGTHDDTKGPENKASKPQVVQQPVQPAKQQPAATQVKQPAATQVKGVTVVTNNNKPAQPKRLQQVLTQLVRGQPGVKTPAAAAGKPAVSLKPEAAPSTLQQTGLLLPTGLPGAGLGPAPMPTDPLTAVPGAGAAPGFGAQPFGAAPGALPAFPQPAMPVMPGFPGAPGGLPAFPGALPPQPGGALPTGFPQLPPGSVPLGGAGGFGPGAGAFGGVPPMPGFPGAAMPPMFPAIPTDFPGDGQMGHGGRTIVPGVTPINGPDGEVTAGGAGSGLGSMLDTSVVSPSAISDPFSVVQSSNGMTGGANTLGMPAGTSASAAAGFGAGAVGTPSAMAARRQSRMTNSGGSSKAGAAVAGAALLVAALML